MKHTLIHIVILLTLVGCGGGGGGTTNTTSTPVVIANPTPPVITPTPAPVIPPAIIPASVKAPGATVDNGETNDPLTDSITYSGPVYYIDCNNGVDTNDGLTLARAWKTLEKVNTKINVGYWDTVAPNANTLPMNHAPWTSAPSGSAFLFKRGCQFDGFLNVHGYISFTNGVNVYAENLTFGAYGTRNLSRPVIQYQTISNKWRGATIWVNNHKVTIKNLTILGNTLSISSMGVSLNAGSPNCTLENVEIKNHTQDGVLADNTTNLLIKNSSIINNRTDNGRGGGLAASGSGMQILYSTFDNNGRDQVGAHNIYIRHLTNTIVQGNILRGGSNLGLVIHGSSSNVSILNNDMDGNSNGLDITGGYTTESEVFDNFTIRENVIHGNGYRLNEQGYGILIKSLTNSLIANNIIYGNRLGSLVFGDANSGDPASSNVQIIHNTIIEPATSYGLTFDGALLTGINYRNNIIYTDSTLTPFKINSNVPNGAIIMNGNMYFAPQIANNLIFNIRGTLYSLPTATGAGLESNSYYNNPSFVDIVGKNFHLTNNSLAKGGAPLTINGIVSITTDYDSVVRATRPSIGAYE